MNYFKIFFVLIIIAGMSGCVGQAEEPGNIVHPTTSIGLRMIGADNHDITLVNNETAKEITYDELLEFLKHDKTDQIPYDENTFICGDYAEMVHNNAEKAGIKAAWVGIDYEDHEGHACNAFSTSDKGIVYIDCTGMRVSDGLPTDSIINMSVGNDYLPVGLFVDCTGMNFGKIRNFEVFW
jgi:hypothetical protein